MDTYASQQQVESYLGRDLTDSEAILFPILSAGIADLIDTYCARSFSSGRSFSSRIDNTTGDLSSNPFQVFDGSEVELFFDQPLQTDTTQSGVIAPYIGAYDSGTGMFTTFEPTGYTFYPANSYVKTSVMMKGFRFPYGYNNIYVYGTFTDYLEPPAAIQLAAMTMAGQYLDNVGNGDLESETIEGYKRVWNKDRFSGGTIPASVMGLLDSYKRVVL